MECSNTKRELTRIWPVDKKHSLQVDRVEATSIICKKDPERWKLFLKRSQTDTWTRDLKLSLARLACFVNAVDLLESFVEQLDVDLTDPSFGDFSPLGCAIANGHLQVVEFAIRKDLDLSDAFAEARKRQPAESRKLFQALLARLKQVSDNLVDTHPDALRWACCVGSVVIVKELLDMGFDPLRGNPTTPLDCVCELDDDVRSELWEKILENAKSAQKGRTLPVTVSKPSGCNN